MCRSHGTQSNASLKVAGFDRSFNRSSLAGFHRSLTRLPKRRKMMNSKLIIFLGSQGETKRSAGLCQLAK